ncbi:hypothetical protein Cst_c08070 [Thermoclostridium stercorarium subsp. stercorarium DSM 8532]|uniref:Uncharacterized protein n=2 Tax=Thermoclostridium stercorarium TaxID=1510 RepID=L7VMD8_THES1|nr:hypothetical protein [Thermoclostridium stercorarium]AGC67809.1 hypothetical protein Cst_c08070 [Thermoclostridium stercorarium subsp. stercorarium DSM 8532]AGI38852.1 hypothetical protein Clst_0771 [Thermoclostridium stercorarium subsp. stercorarium DSM 8532]ANW98210.1 hypothetical protein CSTERTH_03740 [Thermoclostridium stercorarium subsp. thermolacticum DSM 2910]
MDNRKLMEIRNNIAVLPSLREKADKLRKRIRDAERNVEELLENYKKECVDVEQLKNSSFSAFLLKLLGKYQGKLEKEEKEAINAKVQYDRACQFVDELRKELHETEMRIIALKEDERTYEAEMKRREQELLSKMHTEHFENYMKLERERDFIQKQIFEMDEAIRAATRAQSTARSVMGHLSSAEKWATFDVWSNNGIISHMAKYDRIDRAESEINRLYSQLRELKKELSDIDLNAAPGLNEFDTVTRFIDICFDNIFTDLKVRNMIRDNLDQVNRVYQNLTQLIHNIENRKRELQRRMGEIEHLKNELLLSL